ncbi:MAG: RnfABCDGE type electron transport complex subunit D [Methylococcus sp.]|nr:MAG: RnfABCDGE type electron transport complex subunit D [Methylococcus sp.]
MNQDPTPRLLRSPFIRSHRSVGDIMRDVLIALVPGALMALWVYGGGVILQVGLGVATALITEAVLLRLRGRPIQATLQDHSALLTGLLLALCLPPLAPWWVPVTGAVLAITFGKQVYGGLGQNPFNPAMVGYAMLIISFPQEMTLWSGTFGDGPSLGSSLTAVLGSPEKAWWDSIARATPLTVLHDGLKTSLEKGTPLPHPALTASLLINLAYLAGGCWLVVRQALDYRIPLAMLGVLLLGNMTLQTFQGGILGSLQPLFLGSTMLGAFFIATDPVTAANTPRGRWLYGAGIGGLTLLIRCYGNYPDGIAFGVLLMNFAAPSLDLLTRPKAYGHS